VAQGEKPRRIGVAVLPLSWFLPSCRNAQPLRHLPRNPRPVAASELAQAPATAPANNPKSVVDSLMAAMAANDGEKIRSLFALTPPRPMAMEQRNQERPSFAGLIATSSNATAVWRTLNSQPAETRLLQQASIKSNGYSSQADFLFTVEEWGASQVGACAIEATTSTGRDCVHWTRFLTGPRKGRLMHRSALE